MRGSFGGSHPRPVCHRARFTVLAALLVGAGLVVAVVGFGPAHRAVAVTEGQELASTSTYRIDAASGLVRVDAIYRVTNTKPDKVTPTNRTEYYFTGLSVPIETGVAALAVTVDERDATFAVTPFDDDPNGRFAVLDVDYGRRLLYRQTFSVRVTYELSAQPPRSDDPARSNPAYAAFTAYGFADPGLATVRVEVPTGWTSEYIGADLVAEPGFGVEVYQAAAIEDPGTFAVLFTARNDASLSSSRITAGGEAFEIRSWPGDDTWRQFVIRQVRDGVPALEELIGEEWPEEQETDIVEAYTPYLRGYAGWYDPELDVLEIGEDLDDQTVLHELSHAWFNRTRFTERWLSEGLAEEYASKAVEAVGGDPISPEPVSTDAEAAFRLSEWANPAGDADAAEEYGYNASFTVVRSLTDEIGLEGMRRVFEAAASGLIAYPGDLPAETGFGTAADWRRFLDLTEEYGGSVEIEALLRTWVTTAAQAAVLDLRAEARARYELLTRAGAGWAPPRLVRTRMEQWEFDAAASGMEAASAVLEHRDAMRAVLADARLTEPPEIERAYESSAEDFTDVERLISDARARAQALIDRRDHTAEVVADARAAYEEADGFFVDVGLRGVDLGTRLDEAERLAAADQFDAAEAEASAVVDRVGRADDIGRGRALTVVAGAIAVLVLLTGSLLLIRRRHRRRRGPTPEPASEVPPPWPGPALVPTPDPAPEPEPAPPVG